MWALNSFFVQPSKGLPMVLSFSLKIERFVSDSAEIWICGLYIIIKMREDNIPVEKIAYYTGIPKEIIVSI